MIQCSRKVHYTPLCSSPCPFGLQFTIPRGCRGAAPSPHTTGLPLREAQTNAGLRGDPMRADLCPDTQPWCPTQVLAGCRRGYVRPRLPVQLPPRRERTPALAETCRGRRVFPPAAAPFVPDSREKHLAAPRGDIRLGGARPAWPCSPVESSKALVCGGDGVGWLARAGSASPSPFACLCLKIKPLMELHVLQDLQQKLTARRGSPAPAPWCAAAMDVLSPRVSRALHHATLAHATPPTPPAGFKLLCFCQWCTEYKGEKLN